jgi:hypothetical protein
MAALVAALRQAGVEIWAVSSTNKWVVAEGVRDRAFPKSASWPPRCASPTASSPANCGRAHRRGQGRHAQARRAPHPDAVFGNSIHDLAMLEMARNAFPVNPSPALIEAAAKNGWGYFRPEAPRAPKLSWEANRLLGKPFAQQ